jgi:epoxyqueuosine reductase
MDHAATRSEQLLKIALASGASMAGIAQAAKLRGSPSHLACASRLLPAPTGSVLVIALHHPEGDPELDTWGGAGGTRGNLRLIRISRNVVELAASRLEMVARLIDYAPEPRGTFLKDAAVLAGLGVIGRNNLLVTPLFGPRVRIRALALEEELQPSDSEPFDPCSQCAMACRASCPQQAFAQGTFRRDACARQMNADESGATGPADGYRVAYCRGCELSCPVGRA